MSNKKLTTLNNFQLTDLSYETDQDYIEQQLRDQGLKNIKVEAIAQGKYVEDGLNAVIYSTEINGKKEYIVGNAGTNPVSISDIQQNAQFLKDLDDDLQIAIGKTPDQAAYLKAFVEDFKSDHEINEPFQGVAHSLGCVSMASAAAENPELFNHMTLIEGPGVQTFVESKQSDQGIRESLYKKMDIYNGLPNLINTHGKHPDSANIFSINTPKTSFDLSNGEFGIREKLSLTKDTHPLGSLMQEVQKGNVQRSDSSWYRDMSNAYEIKINQEDYSKAALVYKHTGEEVASGKSGFEKVKNGYLYKTSNPFITENDVQAMLGDRVAVVSDEDPLNPTATRSFYVDKQNTMTHEYSAPFSSTLDKVGSMFGNFADSFMDHTENVISYFSGTQFGSNAKVWRRDSDYGIDIQGRYSFLTPFNRGQYSSAYSLDTSVYNPFKAYMQSHFYNQDSGMVFNALRELDFMVWNSEQFMENADYEKMYDDKDFSYTWEGSSDSFRSYDFGSGTKFFGGFHEHEWHPARGGYEIIRTDDSVAFRGRYGTLQFGGAGVYDTMRAGANFLPRMLPIILDLNRDKKINLISLKNSSAFYDINDKGFLKNTGWVTKKDGILAIDSNSDGLISLAKEISFKLWHKDAKTDLDGLKLAFDTNKDMVLNASDPLYRKLLVWQDHNENGISEVGEITTLKERNVNSILLDENSSVSKSSSGDNEILKGFKVKLEGGKFMSAYDVAFKHSNTGISYNKTGSNISLKYDDDSELKIYEIETESGSNVTLKDDLYKIILGNKGNDTIKANGSKGVVIDGYEGNDIIYGGPGDDWLKGSSGSDEIYGGPGHDILLIDHQDNEDKIDGGPGYDVAIVATEYSVKIDLFKTNIEAFYGNKWFDYIDASRCPESVKIDGGPGYDTLLGGKGNDILVGGKGKDTIKGGDGDDHIYIDAEDDLINIDAGSGKDSVYVYGDVGVKIDASAINAENVFGSLGNDHLYNTNNENVVLAGNKGQDILEGGIGDDVLDGGPGDDFLKGGPGSDKYVFYKGAGSDIIENLDSIESKDVLLFYSSINRDNLVFRKNDMNLLISESGSDDDSITIKYWYKSPEQEGHSYKLEGFMLDANTDHPSPIVLKDSGDNSFKMDDGEEWTVFTMDGNDKIGGGEKNDYLNSGEGNDEIIGWGGNDIIVGGKGNDILHGSAGDDIYVFSPGDGNDTILDEYVERVEKRTGVEKRQKVIRVPDSMCFQTMHGFSTCVDASYNKVLEYDVPYEENIPIYADAGKDTIKLKHSAKIEDLTFEKVEQSLKISIANDDSTITIQKWDSEFNKIELLELGGVTHSLEELVTAA